MNAEQKLGYSITIFIAGEKFSGLRTVDKTNWNGRGLICSRSSFPNLKKRDELKKAGIYILAGPPDDEGLPRVYIGEGDPVLPRLEEHHSKKDFWTQAVMFVSKDQTLNKAKIQHLESRLIEMAKIAKRCVLDNASTPEKPSLSEAEEAEAEGFLEELLLCLPTIGVSFFEIPQAPVAQANVGAVANAQVEKLFLETNGAKAEGYESDEGFIVLKGSTAAAAEAESIQDGAKKMRKLLIEQGIVSQQGDFYRFEQDYSFSSVSRAASVIGGNNASGRELWKNAAGKKLKEIQEAEARAE